MQNLRRIKVGFDKSRSYLSYVVVSERVLTPAIYNV